MKLTKFVVATTVVVAVTLNIGAEGFPRPQDNSRTATTIFMVDGFAFDGPASGSRPAPNRPNGLLRTTSTLAPVFPTLSSVVVPNPPTRPPVVDPNPPTQPPVVNQTPSSTTIRPEVALCSQNCQVTSEYNPVCGSDGVMYNNIGHLTCSRNCGINVEQLHLGRCSSPNIRG